MPSAPALRVITDAEAVESLARDREAWADLWQAIARETDAASETPPDEPEPQNDDEERPDEAA
jgi:hypothetical protein